MQEPDVTHYPRIDELFFDFEVVARKKERQARTARAKKCPCGNCISADQTLCGRCDDRRAEADRRQREQDFLHDLMIERGLGDE